MREDFLHYLWKGQRFDPKRMLSAEGQPLYVYSPGIHNLFEGPDFLQARIKIEALEWCGSVEFHLKASDWYTHQHHLDAAYNNVILHLVWEDDVEVYNQEGTRVPTLSVKSWVSASQLTAFSAFFYQKKEGIVCADRFRSVNPLIRMGWKQRLFVERLERRVNEIEKHLVQANQDWEAVFFWYLAKAFGLNHNGKAFFEAAQSLPFAVVRKCSQSVEKLEALFMGQSGLLNKTLTDAYYQKLQKTYVFLKHKFQLTTQGVTPPHFARIRPANFPTIRWAQLAQIYYRHKALFTDLMSKITQDKLLSWCTIAVSPYWEAHYNFGKISPKRPKRLTTGFLQLLEINTLLPFFYFYHRSKGRIFSEEVMDRMEQLPPEKNSIIDYFKTIGGIAESALDSQAYISLKKEYCDQKKCLLCAVGQTLLQH